MNGVWNYLGVRFIFYHIRFLNVVFGLITLLSRSTVRLLFLGFLSELLYNFPVISCIILLFLPSFDTSKERFPAIWISSVVVPISQERSLTI